MEKFKALFTGPALRIGIGFLVGWVAGRGSAVGQIDDTLIGGIVVSAIVVIVVNGIIAFRK